MQYAGNLLQIPVLERDSARQIGRVEEVVISFETAAVEGFVVRDAAWLSEKKYIPFARMERLGLHAAFIPKGGQLSLWNGKNADDCPAYGLKDLLGRTVFSGGGICLGAIADFCFETATGKIQSVEISDGVIGDLLYGRRYLPFPALPVICEDRMIFPDAAAKRFQFLK